MSRPGFPLDDEYFRGLSNVTKPTEGGLADLLNGLEGSAATCTTGELHVYADGTSGDDANDGYAPERAKKTIQAAFDLVPDVVKHYVIVHLSGTFTLSDPNLTVALPVKQLAAGAIVVDGGDDITDMAGGTKTATGSSTSTLTVAGAGWAVDDYKGCQVHVLTGPAAGAVRMVFKNTADTIYPARNWNVDPGVGATFKLARPATTITGDVSLAFQGISPPSSPDVFFLQRLYITTTYGCILAGFSTGVVQATFGATIPLVVYGAARIASIGYGQIADVNNPGSADTIALVTEGRYGTHCPFRFYGYEGIFLIGQCVLGQIKLYRTGYMSFYYGSRANEILAERVRQLRLYSAAGTQPCLIDSSTSSGIKATDCVLTVEDIEISNCTGHGIEAINTRVEFIKATSGTGNTGAGVYAHSGSVVHTKSGSPPTLTGTVGDLSTDGTTQKSTWAAIEAGTPVSDTAEMTMAKKVA